MSKRNKKANTPPVSQEVAAPVDTKRSITENDLTKARDWAIEVADMIAGIQGLAHLPPEAVIEALVPLMENEDGIYHLYESKPSDDVMEFIAQASFTHGLVSVGGKTFVSRHHAVMVSFDSFCRGIDTLFDEAMPQVLIDAAQILKRELTDVDRLRHGISRICHLPTDDLAAGLQTEREVSIKHLRQETDKGDQQLAGRNDPVDAASPNVSNSQPRKARGRPRKSDPRRDIELFRLWKDFTKNRHSTFEQLYKTNPTLALKEGQVYLKDVVSNPTQIRKAVRRARERHRKK